MVNRTPVTVIKETDDTSDETDHWDDDSLMLTPIPTPGRRRSSTLAQIVLDLNPISRSQKVDFYVFDCITIRLFALMSINQLLLDKRKLAIP